MPLILGQERLIPGFEANLEGLEVGGTTEFDITFPTTTRPRRWPAQGHFAVELRSCAKVLPISTPTSSARS
jgi:FKBP-type peptidyl-prolyl cis-trans isomerase (trigger factor)